MGDKTVEEIKRATLAKSVFMNEHSLDSARLAAAAALDLTTAVVQGKLANGIGLVRPPGHHAMKNDVCGFSLCNNVAMAARHAVKNLGISRVLIVDFDVHHGEL
jgi:histone deacetylase 6